MLAVPIGGNVLILFFAGFYFGIVAAYSGGHALALGHIEIGNRDDG